MTSPYSVIEIVGEALPIGESKRMVCVFCNAQHEQSLTITNKGDAIVYICPRAACGKRGRIGGSARTQNRAVATTKPKPKTYNKPLERLPQKIKAWISASYEISETTLGKQQWKYGREDHRLYMPVFTAEGEEVAAVTKVLPSSLGHNTTGPKCVAYWREQLVPKLHFPLRKDGYEEAPYIVLVEDIISAVKVSTITRSCAIMGTNIANTDAIELMSLTNNLIIALDPDAISKAHQMKKRLKGMFDRIIVLSLKQDPKDTPYPELKQAIKEVVV